MVNINGKDVHWTPFPEGWFLTDVKYHVLWKNNDTGATFMLVKIPVGGVFEFPHTHPRANQMGFPLSGEAEREDGGKTIFGEGKHNFSYRTKGTTHGPPSTLKITKEIILFSYYDGPPTKLSEGETEELTLAS
jgi:hypothetical protein